MNPDGVFAFIELRVPAQAQTALELNGRMLHGRPMKVPAGRHPAALAGPLFLHFSPTFYYYYFADGF